MTVRRLLLLLVLAACHHRGTLEVGPAQEIVSFATVSTDSVVLETLRRAHSCPATLPPMRLRADSLASGTRCTLVATALAAVRDSKADPKLRPDLRRFRLDRVTCIDLRAEAYRNATTRDVEAAQWIVELLSDQQSPLAVTIDRHTGAARAYRLLSEFGYRATEICARAT